MIERAGRKCYASEDKIQPMRQLVFEDGSAMDIGEFISSELNEEIIGSKFFVHKDRTHYLASLPSINKEDYEALTIADLRKPSFDAFIRSVIKRGHDSVLEHANATFSIEGVSRALTHQLVRHRLCAYSQRSQRWVQESQFQYVMPPSIRDCEQTALWPDPATGEMKEMYAADIFRSVVGGLQTAYDVFKGMGIKNEDARFVLPNACETKIVMTANFRQLRHMIQLRTSKEAQWEIRECFKQIHAQLLDIAPCCFDDITFEV